MAGNISKYIWLVDLLRRRGRLTRRQINEAWKQSALNPDAEEICRRTFYNYKLAVRELFDIDIACDPVTFEYYIDNDGGKGKKITDWLLNSSAVSDVLSASRDISDRILLEDVPSAREYLPVVFDALKKHSRIRFDYHNYTRSLPTRGVELEPYLARIFKQRWYVVGRNVREDKLKTYALDRMSKVTDTGTVFEQPKWFDPETYFRHSFGIVVNESEPREIVLRTDHHNAKYLAALPLHPSQQQTVQDHYCLFRYRMQITDDLIQELLSHGHRIVVEEPRELRIRLREELKKAVGAYEERGIVGFSPKKHTGSPVTDPDVVRKDNIQQ